MLLFNSQALLLHDATENFNTYQNLHTHSVLHRAIHGFLVMNICGCFLTATVSCLCWRQHWRARARNVYLFTGNAAGV